MKFENLKYDLNDLFENPPAFNEPLLKYDNVYEYEKDYENPIALSTGLISLSKQKLMQA